MGKRLWMGLVLACCAGAAWANGPAAVRKQIESSLLVEGSIDINADGSVAGYALEREAELPKGVVGVIGAAVPHWRFEPVALGDGKVRARTNMSLRLVAKQLDKDSFTLQIRGAQFAQPERPGEFVSSNGLPPPVYPSELGGRGIGGVVYVVAKVGRDGRVDDVVSEQVNLFTIGNVREMAHWRELLVRATLTGARRWTFNPPTRGEDADDSHWLVRVPVSYTPYGHREPKYGEWQAYIPGPHMGNPWHSEKSGISADAVAGGGVYPLDGGPRLLTPLGGS
ncbi:hypothetical protein ACFQZQ_05635 [Lysobacter koreensis]|uniref:Protein tonB n=1 Tax=Lysobacter koreensis TaxID=266122 RepID=A0ABW2YKN4_9GAMM